MSSALCIILTLYRTLVCLLFFVVFIFFFFFKQKTAYEMRISDWSSDVCSSDLDRPGPARRCSANLDGEACDHEAGRGQGFQIVQFFEVAVADVAAGLVALPNDRSVVVGLITGRSEEHTSELPSLMRFAYGVF